MSSFEPFESRRERGGFVGRAAPWLARQGEAPTSGQPHFHAQTGPDAGAGAEERETAAPAPEVREPGPDPAALARASAALERAAAAATSRPPGYLTLHRHCAVELALAIARAVLARELRRDPDALAACLERALRSLEPERPLRLRLPSPDFAALSHGLAPRLEAVRAAGDLAVVEDAELEPGDFALDGGAVDVEARLPEILERVGEALLEELALEAV